MQSSRKEDSIVKVCSAGLSELTAARAGTLVESGRGSLSVELAREIRGAIFADQRLSSGDRLSAYESYLGCVRERGINVEKEDATEAVQRVQFSNDFRDASFFSSYDFIAKYNRGFKNIGDRTVECRLRIRGVLKRKSSGSVFDVGEVNERTFILRAGSVYRTDGDVGIKGFNDERYVVSTDDRLECWYR
jgi:hypothetical protein